MGKSKSRNVETIVAEQRTHSRSGKEKAKL